MFSTCTRVGILIVGCNMKVRYFLVCHTLASRRGYLSVALALISAINRKKDEGGKQLMMHWLRMDYCIYNGSNEI